MSMGQAYLAVRGMSDFKDLNKKPTEDTWNILVVGPKEAGNSI